MGYNKTKIFDISIFKKSWMLFNIILWHLKSEQKIKGRKNAKQKQSNETDGWCDAVSRGPTISSMSVNDEIIFNKSIKLY